MSPYLQWVVFGAMFMLGGVVFDRLETAPDPARPAPVRAAQAATRPARRARALPSARERRARAFEIARLCRRKATIKVGGFRPVPLVHPSVCRSTPKRRVRRRR